MLSYVVNYIYSVCCFIVVMACLAELTNRGNVAFFSAAVTFQPAAGDDHEYRLMEHLLKRYDSRIRPSLNATEPLNVTFGLALAQIIDVVR